MTLIIFRLCLITLNDTNKESENNITLKLKEYNIIIKLVALSHVNVVLSHILLV